MRVAFISTYPPTHCGIAEYTRMLIASLKSLNPRIEVYVVADKTVKKETWYDEYAGAYIYPAFIRGGSNLANIRKVLDEIGRVDILHIQHDYSLYGYSDEIIRITEWAQQQELADKTVITMHTVHHPYTNEPETIPFQKKLNKYNAVIVHSHLQEFELRNQGVEPGKVWRIPHGTLLNPYLGYPRRKLLENLKLREERINGLIAVIPGFLKKDKGLDILLEALKIMKIARKDLTLIVAGEVWDKRVLEHLEALDKVVNLVFWERYLENDEILQLNALADIIVLPYRSVKFYSVSGMLHLSMGSLKPIIGTRVPKLIELYQHAPRLTIPPEKPQQLARTIKTVTRNYDLIVPYMSSLYSYAIRTQWHRMAQRHQNLYNQLLRKTRKPTIPPKILAQTE